MEVADRAAPIPPKFLTLGLLTMTVRVAQGLWVIRTRDKRFLISRAHGTVAYNSLELATFFANKEEATLYMQSLEAGAYAGVEVASFFELIKERMQSVRNEAFFRQPPPAPPDLPPGLRGMGPIGKGPQR